jgi:hypothetical protein
VHDARRKAHTVGYVSAATRLEWEVEELLDAHEAQQVLAAAPRIEREIDLAWQARSNA